MQHEQARYFKGQNGQAMGARSMTMSFIVGRGDAACTPGNHKCVALMLAFFDALDGATVTGITERAVAECEQRMKETSDE